MLPIEKLEGIARRLGEIESQLCDAAVLSDPARSLRLNKEHSELAPVVAAFRRYQQLGRDMAEDREALGDPELRALAEHDLSEHQQELQRVGDELQHLLLPADPHDVRNTVVEIRSGTGGEEAALFAADLFRMVCRFAERHRWKVEVLHSSESSSGGFKEIISLISGKNVYSHLRYEAGVHRVQRVPATEAQGRIHTSTATVAVLPEADEVDVRIDESELEISIAASGGPGGQGVNTTNSAVQIRHIPSGLIVKCQDERSQHKNKARAMKVLRSRLLQLAEREQRAATSAERRTMVGGAERSEKVRTYNFPQNRVTDHRIGLTVHRLGEVLDGDLDDLVAALQAHRQAELLRQEGSG